MRAGFRPISTSSGIDCRLAAICRRRCAGRTTEGEWRNAAVGNPTVADRIAQEVVRRRLEPSPKPTFHANSYGYRSKLSAVDAIRVARQRCWRSDWVLDIDIKGFLDSIDHEPLLRAACKHTGCAWVRLYIDRTRRQRCSTMATLSRGNRERQRAVSSRRYSRTCSCTPRSTSG
ncbi:reverse transcriptase domain-containing protein [Bradyrhizobium elkanii]|uniref:reverse transcriptase domain-containing protein n=1 Tax=Bradyrhizobium elkanii TaxID=29448 RepID=UPI0023EB788F|nr:reverse transcriptase domain-containing protein [Bradyrhizobium elkanii]